MLGEQLLDGKHSIVVAGTHGKTTTTSLIAHILLEAGRDPSLFVGGVPVALGQGWRLGNGADFVIEGDEYDTAFFDKGPKFLHYRPQHRDPDEQSSSITSTSSRRSMRCATRSRSWSR